MDSERLEVWALEMERRSVGARDAVTSVNKIKPEGI
jgi:hypothetical protein